MKYQDPQEAKVNENKSDRWHVLDLKQGSRLGESIEVPFPRLCTSFVLN